MSSDRDVDDVSDRLHKCIDLERTQVHPMFYDLALEIAQLKTKKKGAAAISAFQRKRDPPTLSQQELETIFQSDACVQLVQVVTDCVRCDYTKSFAFHNFGRNSHFWQIVRRQV